MLDPVLVEDVCAPLGQCFMRDAVLVWGAGRIQIPMGLKHHLLPGAASPAHQPQLPGWVCCQCSKVQVSLSYEALGRRGAQDCTSVAMGSVEGLHTNQREA